MAIEVVPFSSTGNTGLETVRNENATGSSLTNGTFTVDLSINSDITGGGTAAFQTNDLLLLFHTTEQTKGNLPTEGTGNTHNTANFTPSISYGFLGSHTSNGFIDLGYARSTQGGDRKLCVGAYALVIPSTDTLQNGTLRMTYTGLGSGTNAKRTSTLKCFILRGVDVSDFASASSLGVVVARSSASSSPDGQGDIEWVAPTSEDYASTNYTGTITQFLHGSVRRNGGIVVDDGGALPVNANPQDNTNNTLPTTTVPGAWDQDTEGTVTEGGQDDSGGTSSHRRITYFNTNRTFSGLAYPYAFRLTHGGSNNGDTNSGGTLSILLREAATSNNEERSAVESAVTSEDIVTPTHVDNESRHAEESAATLGDEVAVKHVDNESRHSVESAVAISDDVAPKHVDNEAEHVQESAVTATDDSTPAHLVITAESVTETAVGATDAVEAVHGEALSRHSIESAVTVADEVEPALVDAWFRSATEVAVTAADEVSSDHIINTSRTVTEAAIAVGDTVVADKAGHSASAEDTTTSSDSVVPDHQGLTQVNVIEAAVSATDTPVVTHGEAKFEPVVETAVSIADVVDEIIGVTRSLTESAASLGDEVEPRHGETLTRSTEDSIASADLVDRLVGESIEAPASLSEINATDEVGRDTASQRSAEDSVSAGEDCVRNHGATRLLTESAVSTEDEVDIVYVALVSPAETVGVSDAVEEEVLNVDNGTKHSVPYETVISANLGCDTQLDRPADVTATATVACSFVIKSSDGLVENITELDPDIADNAVDNMAITVSVSANATPAPLANVACVAEGGIVGLTLGLGVTITAGTGAGGGAGDGGFGGVHVIPEDLTVTLTGGVSIGGADLDAEGEVVINGHGDVNGTFNALWLDNEVIIQGKGSVSPDFLTNGELMSVEEVWNTALTQLGVTTIGSTSDQSPQATLLSGVWNGGFRTKFLADHTWNGGKRTAELAKYVDNPTGGRWNYAFTLPSDYIRALRVNGKQNVPDSYNAASSGGSGGRNIWEIEVVANDSGTLARCLLTDEQAVALEYMFDVGDANIDLLAPMTRWAMGLALAAHAAPNFGKSTSDIQMLEAKAQDAIVAAKGVDGQEGTSQMFQSTSLLDCRY